MNYLEYLKTGNKIIYAKKGWYASEMDTWDDNKKRQILELYGEEGLTPNTYKYLSSKVGKVSSKTPILQPQNKDLPSFEQWLYTSGGMGAGRRAANVFNVLANYAHGMLHPDGNTVYDLGEGNERLLYAGYLYNQNHPKKGKKYAGINDTAHTALGGMGKAEDESGTRVARDSGDSFRNRKGFSGMLDFAASSPYHNIYGQSAGARIDENGDFVLESDGYTFNNDWSNYNSKTKKGVKVYGDGELSNGLINSIRAGIRAFKNTNGGVLAAMETAATQRGVNTKRNSDVKRISSDQIKSWEQEYLNFLSDPKKQEEYFAFVNK